MNTNKKYNIWFALCYEIINDLKQYYPSLKKYKIIKLILDYCRHDWILWKVESTLDSVDRDIDRIKKEWDAQEKPKYTYIEHEPDGSKAQDLLGGAMEIRSNFKRD